jgi:hypothetical protein
MGFQMGAAFEKLSDSRTTATRASCRGLVVEVKVKKRPSLAHEKGQGHTITHAPRSTPPRTVPGVLGTGHPVRGSAHLRRPRPELRHETAVSVFQVVVDLGPASNLWQTVLDTLTRTNTTIRRRQPAEPVGFSREPPWSAL